MGSKINRGFMFYLFILLGIVLGAFLVCFVIMIFVPEFSLFGIKCYNENIEDRFINMAIYSNEDDTELNGTEPLNSSSYVIENIEIDSEIHSVKVFKSNDLQGINYSQFVAIFTSKSFGFTTGDTSKSSLSVSYYLDTKTLKIEATGPEGFLSFGNNCTLTLQIPPTYSTDNINLIVDTTKDVTVGDIYNSPSNTSPNTINLKSINLKTEGTVNVTEYTNIGSTTRGNCSIETGGKPVTVDTVIRANDLSIKTGETTLSFNEDGQSFDLTGDLSIETNNAFAHFGSIIADNLYLKNSYGKMYFTQNITGNVVIDKDSKKCDYEFVNIVGGFTAGSYLDELMIDGGYILVNGTISGEVSIASTGDINIKRVNSITNIKNTSGDVTIDQTQLAVNIKTVDGDITLGQIKDENGEFVSCGIGSRVTLEVIGNGKIYAYFNTFDFGDIESEITTNTGIVNIRLIENMNKNITATTTANLKYLGVNIESKTGTWTVGTAKALIVNSNSDITIVNR